MDKDKFDGLITLKQVAEQKSFAGAARILGISSSAVSQIIKQLEYKLKVPLLTRTTRSTRLTEAGEIFLKSAAPAIDQLATAIDSIGAQANKPIGLLRINMPTLFYNSFLEPIVESFRRKYPDVTVEIFLEDKSSDIVEGGFDAGIRVSDILAKDMIAIKLAGPVRYVAVASPKYLNKSGRPKHPKDLLKLDCIRGRPDAELYDLWEFEHKGRPLEVEVKGSLIFNNPMMILQSAIKGFGVAYLDELTALPYIKSKKLEVLLKDFVSTSTGYYLYYPSKSQVQPKLRAFIDHLRTENSSF